MGIIAMIGRKEKECGKTLEAIGKPYWLAHAESRRGDCTEKHKLERYCFGFVEEEVVDIVVRAEDTTPMPEVVQRKSKRFRRRS